jgi:hypothetical protein
MLRPQHKPSKQGRSLHGSGVAAVNPPSPIQFLTRFIVRSGRGSLQDFGVRTTVVLVR